MATATLVLEVVERYDIPDEDMGKMYEEADRTGKHIRRLVEQYIVDNDLEAFSEKVTAWEATELI